MGFFITLLIFAALFLLSELLRPKPNIEDAKPAGLGDFNFPTATEGRAVPIVWGTIQITGPNVVWYGNLVTQAIEEEVKTGLFSSDDVTVGYRYYVGLQMALCRGPIDQLRKVWVGDDILFDASSAPLEHGDVEVFSKPWLFGGDDVGGNGGMWGALQLFGGTNTQTVSTYLSKYQKIPVTTGDTPAYRGVCYVCPNTGPFYVGNSASIKPWKFELRRLPEGWSDYVLGGVNYPYDWTAYKAVNTHDANPALVLYEILTNADWGLGFTDADLDIPSFYYSTLQCHSEDNGFSMILDQAQEANDLLRLALEQIDAVLYQDQETGLWTLTMIRPAADLSDPSPPAVLPIDGSNMIKLENFTRGSWDNTPNQLLLEFNDRSDHYKQTYAGAQDMGNIRIQDLNVRSQIRMPGVKSASLAGKLVWRELMTMSYPLVKATVTVDRSFWNAKIGQRVSFSDTNLGVTNFGMRIGSLNLGRLTEGEVRLELVEDIFRDVDAAFADVPGSGWVDPAETVEAFDYEISFESPRAFNSRISPSPEFNRIWAGGRRVASESAFDIMGKLSGETSYAKVGDSNGFMLIGKLDRAIARDTTAIPWYSGGTTLFEIDPDPDTVADMVDALPTSNPAYDVQGSQLLGLIKIDDEFMLVNIYTSATSIAIQRIFRGVMDSVQAAHLIDAPVYFLIGNVATQRLWNSADDVDIKLLPKSLAGILDIGDATEIGPGVLLDRARAPYVPSRFTMNGIIFNYPATLDLEAGVGTWDTNGTVFTFRRRDYRVYDETAHIIADAATFVGDFPSANSHVIKVEVWKDYATTPVLLLTGSSSTTGYTALINEILRYNLGVVPTTVRFVVYSEHVDAGDTIPSVQEYTIDVPTVTAGSLTGLFNMGTDAAAGVSNAFTVATAGVHNLRIATAFANNIQYSINGAAWLPLITGGATNGNTASLTVGQTIQFRHSETTTDLIQLAYFRDSTATDVAYWVPYV